MTYNILDGAQGREEYVLQVNICMQKTAAQQVAAGVHSLLVTEHGEIIYEQNDWMGFNCWGSPSFNPTA